MFPVPDELRQILESDGAPLALADYERSRCYMLMPVRLTDSAGGLVQARVPGINAAGESEQLTDAVAALESWLQDMCEDDLRHPPATESPLD